MMRTWQCACGVENRVTSHTCCSCQTEMPASEVRRICTEVRTLLKPEVRRLVTIQIANRLKKEEAVLKKCRVFFWVLQVVSLVAAGAVSLKK